MNSTSGAAQGSFQKWYMPYLLIMAGIGGLLYGIDVGVIAGALPYLEATRGYDATQLSTVVAAVLLGSVFSSLFAGALSDLLGRKAVMIIAGVCFVASVPIICIPQDFSSMVAGRILQGAAAGLIGVVVPLYLAECLTAEKRGSGTGMFQFLLTVGLVFAAAIGWVCAKYVENKINLGLSPAEIFEAKEFAWQAIFWICAIPGVIFTFGCFLVSESPRWLYSKGKKAEALATLQRSRLPEVAQAEYDEMSKESNKPTDGDVAKPKYTDSIFSKKYVVPFIIAVIILACNQATGINSVLAYIVNVLNEAGLPGSLANTGDLAVKILNCLMTVVAVILVDRKGRKFLLIMGTSGIIVALLGVAFLFRSAESQMQDYTQEFKSVMTACTVDTAIQNKIIKNDKGEIKSEYIVFAKNPQNIKFFTQQATLDTSAKVVPESFKSFDLGLQVDSTLIQTLIAKDTRLNLDMNKNGAQIKIVYNYGGIEGMKTFVVRPPENKADEKLTSEEIQKKANAALYASQLNAEFTLKVNKADFKKANDDSAIGKAFRKIKINPFSDPAQIDQGKFDISRVEVGPIPSETHGWLVTVCFIIFISAFAVGPGVCVWLALSELMPTRIRSNGMSIALLINQFVSTAIAAVFLPVVGSYGYSAMFFFCAGCTVIYFITVTFFLPETKGKTLEEIEAIFAGKKKD